MNRINTSPCWRQWAVLVACLVLPRIHGNQLPQTIQFVGPSVVYMTNPTVTLNATASSGLPVIFLRESGWAGLQGSVLTANRVGPISIRIDQPGDSLYLAAPTLRVVIQAVRAPQRLEFNPPTQMDMERPVLSLTATTDSGLPVEFSVVSGPAQIRGDTLTTTGPGILMVRARQPGNTVFDAVQVDREILVRSATGNGRSLLDPSLQLDLRVSGGIDTLASLADGSILAGGQTLQAPTTPTWPPGEVIHLSSVGELDSEFPNWTTRPGSPNQNLGTLLVRGESEVIITGIERIWTHQGYPEMRTHLYRFDWERSAWSYIDSIPNEVRPFPDSPGGVIFVGQMRGVIPGTTGSAVYAHLSRMGADNRWDPRFAIPYGMATQTVGEQSLAYVHALRDGSVIVAGKMHWPVDSFDNFIPNSEAFRLGPDGAQVWRYTPETTKWVTPVTFAAETPDARLILFPSRKMLDARTGQYVGRFPVPPEVIASTTAFFQEPDGRLILAGTFTNYAGIRRRGLAAVLPDGTLDPSFDPGLGTTNGFKVITRQADRSLLLAGAPGIFDGVAHRGLIRLYPRNPDYSPAATPEFHLLPPDNPVYECTGAASLRIIRTGGLDQTNRVRVQTVAGSATPGEDFVPVDEELVFEPGQRLKTVPLRVLRDQVAENLEEFTVRTSFEPGVAILNATNLTVRIANFDCGAYFFVPGYTNQESAPPVSVQMITDSEPATQVPPFGYTTRIRTRDLSARAGHDYRAFDGSPVGVHWITPQIHDNSTVEGDRMFLVEAYDSETGETINPDKSLVVTIQDDDTLAGPARGFSGDVESFVPIEGGWLALGGFQSVDGISRPGLARLRLDGTLDTSFASPLEFSAKTACAVGTSDGGMFVGGDFPPNLPDISGEILKLDATGQIDPTFRLIPPPDSAGCRGAVNQPISLGLESGGNLLAAGEFDRFFGCGSGWSLLRISPAGQILGRWAIPKSDDFGTLRLSRTPSGSVHLFAGTQVYRVTAAGPQLMDGVSLVAGYSPVVLKDGRLAGVGGTGGALIELRIYRADGGLQGVAIEFGASGDRWYAYQLHSLAQRADGAVLLSGIFYSATKPKFHFRTMTLAFDPDALTPGTLLEADEVSTLRLTALIPHPDGPMAGLPVFAPPQTHPKWWRLDSTGAVVSDVAFRLIIADAENQVHLALSGQAPDGYSIETSDDLVNWTPWFTSNETNWGMTFRTPPLPAELLGRFFRIR